MDRLTKPVFNADDAEEYFSMQLGYYRTCQKDIFNRDNQNRDSNNFVYSAEYQKYLGMEIAMREVLNYFAKYELSCEMKLQPLIPQQIVEMQNQLAEAKLPCVWCKGDWAENFSVIDEDFGQRLTYRHIKYCPMCGRKLKQANDIDVGNIKETE